MVDGFHRGLFHLQNRVNYDNLTECGQNDVINRLGNGKHTTSGVFWGMVYGIVLSTLLWSNGIYYGKMMEVKGYYNQQE